jgi:hypothetical protein
MAEIRTKTRGAKYLVFWDALSASEGLLTMFAFNAREVGKLVQPGGRALLITRIIIDCIRATILYQSYIREVCCRAFYIHAFSNDSHDTDITLVVSRGLRSQ